MADQNKRVAEFLDTVRRDYGEELRSACEDLVKALPRGGKFRPSAILTQARLLEPHLQNLAAMNASPFDSARD